MGNRLSRRGFIGASAATLGALSCPQVIAGEAESPLIYLSTVKTDGSLSRCQAEVWYVADGTDLFVVTGQDAWRAKAVGKGLTRTQVWVGDVGQWQRANGKYRSLPGHIAEASLVDDTDVHASALAKFGIKYAAEWGTWGPRFRNGLADGSRVLLRYRAIA